jgi:hypothetical protein
MTRFVALLVLLSISGFARAQDFMPQNIHFNPVMQPKEAITVVGECAKDKICSTAVSNAAKWLGVPPALVEAGITLAAETVHPSGSEETRTFIRFPADFTYCRLSFAMDSITPTSGDRASKFWLDTRDNLIEIGAWTPRQRVGGGRSWVDARVSVVAVRRAVAQQYRRENKCFPPKEGTALECRGNGCTGGSWREQPNR